MHPKVSPRKRIIAINMFRELVNLCWCDAEELESSMMYCCIDEESYVLLAKRVCHNIYFNPSLKTQFNLKEIPFTSDDSLRACALKKLEDAEVARAQNIHNLLKEKYEAVNAAGCKTSILRCRACGGSDISWNQVQTRGADESMTIFCACSCGNRWKMT